MRCSLDQDPFAGAGRQPQGGIAWAHVKSGVSSNKHVGVSPNRRSCSLPGVPNFEKHPCSILEGRLNNTLPYSVVCFGTLDVREYLLHLVSKRKGSHPNPSHQSKTPSKGLKIQSCAEFCLVYGPRSSGLIVTHVETLSR